MEIMFAFLLVVERKLFQLEPSSRPQRHKDARTKERGPERGPAASHIRPGPDGESFTGGLAAFMARAQCLAPPMGGVARFLCVSSYWSIFQFWRLLR